jgi:hypothetical protein
MANYTRNTLTGDLAPVNAELEKVQKSIADKLDRNPSTGQANQLDSTLDANNNRIINLPAPSHPNDPARLKDLTASTNSSILPPQESQTNKYLRTDGSAAYWDGIVKATVGLSNVDNTSDVNKPISTPTQNALDSKTNVAITTTSLISSTVVYEPATVINTSGFTTSGDGGDAPWKQNGLTGQTVSQSPLQLLNGLFNDGNGVQWALVKGAMGDIRKTGALTTALDNHAAIMAMHNSLNDGDTLLIPNGSFLSSAVTTTKRLNHKITGELRRAAATTTTDSVLDIQGNRSTIYGGGVVSWNVGVGSDNGRGEAIRLSGDAIYANNVTGADTFTATGNGWFVEGTNCVVDACKGLNSAFAGIRSNMSQVDSSGEPTGEITINDFVAINCRRGWVNGRFANVVNINNFQIRTPATFCDVQLLAEVSDDIKFNKLTITNTFIHQNLSVGASSLVKFVGVKEVNLINCDFDVLESTDVDALTLQNEHTGTATYQENTLNATQCRFRSYDTTVLNIDHLQQWRINTKQCQFITALGATRSNLIDVDQAYYWYSVDDTFECETSATTYVLRIDGIGDFADKRFSFIRPRFKGQAFTYFIGGIGTEFNIGQLQVVDPKFDTFLTASNWINNSGNRDAKVIISEMMLHKDTGRDFAALASVASGLTASNYAQGDRVHIRDVGDTGIYKKIKGATVWRDFS